MKHPVSDVAFTPSVEAVQELLGSRTGYASMEQRGDWNDRVTPELATFIGERDTMFIATTNADGQPYIQHRGGPPELDAEGSVVDRDAGGATQTRWKIIPGGYRQQESGPIHIGSRWACRQKRSGHGHVIIAVMHTILHELMGHWARVGHKVRGTNANQRRTRAEANADHITAHRWNDLKRRERWDECVAELEEEFETRKPDAEEDIRKCVNAYLESLGE